MTTDRRAEPAQIVLHIRELADGDVWPDLGAVTR